MTPQQWAAIELQTVEFFRQVICCHTDNQHLFATVLCDVIRTNSSFSRGTAAIWQCVVGVFVCVCMCV